MGIDPFSTNTRFGFVKLDLFIRPKAANTKKKPRKSKDNPEPKLTDAQKGHNKAVSKIRVRVEHAIKPMNIFNIMARVYRNYKKSLRI